MQSLDLLVEGDPGSVEDALQFSEADAQACVDELGQAEVTLSGSDLTDQQRTNMRSPDFVVQAELSIFTVFMLTMSSWVQKGTGLVVDTFSALVPKSRALLTLARAASTLSTAGSDSRLILVALLMLLYGQVVQNARRLLGSAAVSADDKDRIRAAIEPLIKLVEDARTRQQDQLQRSKQKQGQVSNQIDQQESDNQLQDAIDRLYAGEDVPTDVLFSALGTLDEQQQAQAVAAAATAKQVMQTAAKGDRPAAKQAAKQAGRRAPGR